MYWKGPEIYRFSRSATQNFLRWPTMVTDTLKDFESPSKLPSYAPAYFEFGVE